MLKIENLSKSFNKKEVLKNISFEINSGEIGVLLGKSGAGKTTILRCIAGLESFNAGSIVIDGVNLKNNSFENNLKGRVGMVFQSFNLFPHLTVLENIIEAPVQVLKISAEEATKIALDLLEKLDLKSESTSYPDQLSGGQKQRVAIARSLAMNPKVLCFDEPTSALDRENINKVEEIIKSFKNQNIAILIITHDEDFSKKVADKIIYIEDGKILKEL